MPFSIFSHSYINSPFFIGHNIILWRRGSSVITAANLMITRDVRFKLLKGYSLQMNNVKPTDAGDYNCQVGDQENRDLVHTVEILVPPSVKAIPDSQIGNYKNIYIVCRYLY